MMYHKAVISRLYHIFSAHILYREAFAWTRSIGMSLMRVVDGPVSTGVRIIDQASRPCVPGGTKLLNPKGRLLAPGIGFRYDEW